MNSPIMKKAILTYIDGRLKSTYRVHRRLVSVYSSIEDLHSRIEDGDFLSDTYTSDEAWKIIAVMLMNGSIKAI